METHQSDLVDQAELEKLDSLVGVLENRRLSGGGSTLFGFDPNTISLDSLILLGFPKKVGERLINYRSKGGVFRVKGDVKKIYGLSDGLYTNLHAYIDLPDSLSDVSKRPASAPFNINHVTIDELSNVATIGKSLAKRVVKYRDLLGGFIQKDQYDEVYGISDQALKTLKSSSFILKEFRPRLLKINHDSLNILEIHPYISKKLAEDIIRFREINSTIESEKVLSNFKSIDKSNFEKLIFYLDFQ